MTVVVRRPADHATPTIARDVGVRLDRAGYPDMAVDVEFVERQRAPADAA